MTHPHHQTNAAGRSHLYTRLLLTCALFGWALGLLSAPAVCAGDIGRAVNAYKQGYNLYYQQKYRLALQYFLLSHQSLPEEKRYANTRNALNFLIGDCYYQLKQDKEAYVRLQAFTTALPKKARKDNEQFAKAQLMLKTLRKHLGLPGPGTTVVARRTAPPQRRRIIPRITPRTPPPPTATHPHPFGWVLAALGVISIAGAVITGITAKNTMQDAFDKQQALAGTPQPFANAVSSRAKDALTQSTIANALYATGGGLTGIGVIMLLAWRVPSQTP